jgi:hypothetical protein
MIGNVFTMILYELELCLYGNTIRRHFNEKQGYIYTFRYILE